MCCAIARPCTSTTRAFRCPTFATSSAMSTYPRPRSTHVPPPKPSAEPSKPPTSTSSPTTCPNGTKIPDCSTGSPRSEAPADALCAALGLRSRPHQGRWVSAAHNPTLHIGGGCEPHPLQHLPRPPGQVRRDDTA